MSFTDLTYRLILILSKLIFQPTIVKVEGKENLPKNKGFIIAANHVNSFDPFVIGVALGDVLTRDFLSKGKKLFYIGDLALRKRIYSFFLGQNLGYLPAKKDSVNIAVQLLRAGNIIGIFPEGHRTRGSKLLKGKKGVGFIALLSGAPVIPTACFGLPSFGFSQGLKSLISSKKVIFGPQLEFFTKDYNYLIQHLAVVEQAVDMIMLEIAKLKELRYEF